MADFRLATALRSSLEVVDLAHPAGQWVTSGENLGHHLQVIDFKRLNRNPTPQIAPLQLRPLCNGLLNS